MSNLKDIYDLEEEKSENEIRYFFISKGVKDIIKIVQYIVVDEIEGKDVYNLGFGDFDFINGTIQDDVNSNNGDIYKVFNTVLSTISTFFDVCPNSIIMVEGSDSRPEFVKQCMLTCKKQCNDECKNAERRINIYRNYVLRNYELLKNTYQFFGTKRDNNSQPKLRDFTSGEKIDTIFLLKRNA